MTATVLAEASIPGLPSASGIELIGPVAYVVSDDAPFVYLLDAAKLVVVGQARLYESTSFGSGRIPKSTKADVEALTALTWPSGEAGVLAMGSGSMAARENGWFLPVAGGAAQPVGLAPLYALLRAYLPAGARLNVEAAASTDAELLLFQRSLGVGNAALIFRLPLQATLHFLTSGGAAPAVAAPQSFELPTIDGLAAGFSGATFVQGRLFVSASVEATDDAVLDGRVLGSFIGVLDEQYNAVDYARLEWADGRAYIGKVEGLAVRRALGLGRWELLLVTDDDAGGSTAVVAEVATGPQELATGHGS